MFMSFTRSARIAAMAIALAAMIVPSGQAEAVGPTFTYQGQLKQNNGLINGMADFQFSLWDAATLGNQIGGAGNTISATLTLSGGVFSTDLNFGATAFDGNDRWLQVAVRYPAGGGGYSMLTPRQKVQAAPYALYAANSNLAGTIPGAVNFTNAANAFTGNGAALTNLNAGNLTGTLASSLLNGTYGNALTLNNVGNVFTGSGAGLTSLNATNITTGTLSALRLPSGGSWPLASPLNIDSNSLYIDATNNRVGIGTAAPLGVFEVAAGTNSYIRVDPSFGDFHANGGDDGTFGIFNEGIAGGRTSFISNSIELFSVLNDGRVGVGTSNVTTARMTVPANAGGSIHATAFLDGMPVIQAHNTGIFQFHPTGDAILGDADAGRGVVGTSVSNDGVFGQSTTDDGVVGFASVANRSGVWGNNSGPGVGVAGSSNTGIGVSANSNGAGLGAPALLVNNTNPTGIAMVSSSTSSDGNFIVANNGGGPLIRGFNGGCCPVFEVHNSGRTVCTVLEIIGGSDLAEPFNVNVPSPSDLFPVDAIRPEPDPGMVVVIDPENPGELKLAMSAYDRKVAGIISGANALAPGMVMRAADSLHADGEHPVALTGRVWCWCDASTAAIEPGDMLTTSEIPGHAMKAVNLSMAQGAIIGKAMTHLHSGQRGLVLVLVNLQ